MTSNTKLDLDYVRGQFPGLHRGWALLDNAGGSQILKGAVDRIGEFLLERNVQIGGSYAVSQAAAAGLAEGRVAAQTLFNAARPEEVVFGPSTTVLTQNLALAMRGQLNEGDEIVVSSADHESNIGPWERLRDMGVVIRYWPINKQTYALDLSDLDALMSSKTKLVCVHHVSNILGAINPIADITAFVHERGARICVDGVAYAPHRAIDVQALDVDYYIFSFYKTYGPHFAAMYGKYDHLLELDPLYHYFYGRDKVPGKLEPGNPNYELAYSVVAIVDYLAELGRQAGAVGSKRAFVEAGFASIAAQEDVLLDRLMNWLKARNDCMIVGRSENNGSTRIPTVSFRFDGQDAGEIARKMDDYGMAIRFGDFHSRRLVEDLDLSDRGGVLRVSMVHYNTLEEVDRLTRALEEIVSGRTSADPAMETA